MGDRTVQFGDDQRAKYRNDAKTLIAVLKILKTSTMNQTIFDTFFMLHSHTLMHRIMKRHNSGTKNEPSKVGGKKKFGTAFTGLVFVSVF